MPGVKYGKNVNTSKDAWEQLEKLAKSIDPNAKKYRYGYSGNSEKTGSFCITPDGFEADNGAISWKDATKITEADFKRYLKESIITRKEVCASASRKFRFSDGSIITASTAEEAKAKHSRCLVMKVTAKRKGPKLTEEQRNSIETMEKEILELLKSNGLKDYTVDVDRSGYIEIYNIGDDSEIMENIGKADDGGYIDFDNKDEAIRFIKNNINEFKELSDALNKISENKIFKMLLSNR